ncbi:biogenesis of lysosome-related organelles complex 1 subunit 6 [Passer montanus]|uniref:biogenesis of lysosome-related organelles complex 1 subunit 6 n=1 Tax=Passer montanus TaxID=9160 RepID=UPI00195FABE1|nr:biogenesis of lysosome-related organelles complex 1 subunit 6 [Passer montanus]
MSPTSPPRAPRSSGGCAVPLPPGSRCPRQAGPLRAGTQRGRSPRASRLSPAQRLLPGPGGFPPLRASRQPRGAEGSGGERRKERRAPPAPGRSLGPSDASPDEGVVEDLPLIDEKAVEQLTEGLISHYLPDLQRSKSALQELTQNQVVLLETLEQEISKFKDCNSIVDINALFSEAKHYHNKLVNIRNEMMMLHEKTSKLKKRALKLQQKRQKEELEREQQREKELEREKQLTAKPAKRT